MPGRPDTKDFLTALWQGIGEGFVVGRLLPSGQSVFQSVFFRWPNDLEAIVSWAAVAETEGTSFLGFGIRSAATLERNVVKAIAAYWTTINLQVVPLDRASEALKGFPAKPSAGLIVKDVLHVFWFLKEALVPEEFDIVWGATHTIISKLLLGTQADDTHKDALLRKANLQAQHFDFDGIFRAPGQANSSVVAWHPEIRYGIEEFTNLLCPKGLETKAPGDAPAHPKATGLDIPEADRDKMIRAMAENWFEAGGMTRHLAGMFAHAGIEKAAAKHIVTEACQAGGGDHAKAPGVVDEAYARLARGETVTGGTSLDKAFDQLPGYAREKAKRALDKVRNLLPREDDEGPEPDFTIKNPIVKFDSRPARWSATLTLPDGRDMETTCETPNFIIFSHFQAAFYEQTNVLLNDITQYRWKQMLKNATIEVKETPPEARPEGAIDTAVEEFLDESRENPDVGILKTFAGHDEESHYFRIGAFKDFLKETGHRFEDRVVYDSLKRLGFDRKVKRIGSKTYKVWAKAMKGETEGNGHPGAQVEAKPPDNPDLFGPEAGGGG